MEVIEPITLTKNGNGDGPRNPRETAALDMLAAGIVPVRLGTSGDWLKRPVTDGWQTAVITPDDVRQWFNEKPNTNIGARGGQNAVDPSLYLARLDFDEKADQIFPAFKEKLGALYDRLAVSRTR
ncbi:MAG: hypothetical protein GY803_09560, partial [Chloroflexi bacterium]|nr:hypothetical protein [Chloroflexota bacterium]